MLGYFSTPSHKALNSRKRFSSKTGHYGKKKFLASSPSTMQRFMRMEIERKAILITN